MREYLETECSQTYTQSKGMKRMKPRLACREAPNIDPQCDWFDANEYSDMTQHDQDYENEVVSHDL